MQIYLSENNKQTAHHSPNYGETFFVVWSQVNYSSFTNKVLKAT